MDKWLICELVGRARTFGLTPGTYIGSGLTRTVFEDAEDPTQFIKIEDDSGGVDNRREWEAWTLAQQPEYAHLLKWMVPCVRIVAGGFALIQKRAGLIHEEGFTVRVPRFFADTHTGNFSLYEGQIRLHEYAENRPAFAKSEECIALRFTSVAGGFHRERV